MFPYAMVASQRRKQLHRAAPIWTPSRARVSVTLINGLVTIGSSGFAQGRAPPRCIEEDENFPYPIELMVGAARSDNTGQSTRCITIH